MGRSREKIQVGAIMPDFLYTRVDWENKRTIPFVLGALINIENKRLYYINKDREEGRYAWIPTDKEWFDYEIESLAKDLSISERQIKNIKNELVEYGLIDYQVVYKPKVKTKNCMKKVNKGIFSINWDFMDRMNEKYDVKSHPKISLEELTIEAKKMRMEESFKSRPKKRKPAQSLKSFETIDTPTEVNEAHAEPARPLEEPMVEIVRTLENHPEEDEDLIDIISKIFNNSIEEVDDLAQEYCQGHKENKDLFMYYFNMYKNEILKAKIEPVQPAILPETDNVSQNMIEANTEENRPLEQPIIEPNEQPENLCIYNELEKLREEMIKEQLQTQLQLQSQRMNYADEVNENEVVEVRKYVAPQIWIRPATQEEKETIIKTETTETNETIETIETKKTSKDNNKTMTMTMPMSTKVIDIKVDTQDTTKENSDDRFYEDILSKTPSHIAEIFKTKDKAEFIKYARSINNYRHNYYSLSYDRWLKTLNNPEKASSQLYVKQLYNILVF